MMSKRKLVQSVLLVVFAVCLLAQVSYGKTRVIDLNTLDLKEKLLIKNPNPKELPELRIAPGAAYMNFPNIPNSKTRAWIYECKVDYIGVRDLGSGKAEVYHRFRDIPHIIAITTITTEKGAVEYLATLAVEKGSENKDIPAEVPVLNICWSVGPSSTFHFRDPTAHYSKFVERCFIFTEQGRTFLNTIPRNPIKTQDKDHYKQHPYAWVGTYNRSDQQTTIAPDSYWYPNEVHHTANIIGVCSIDKDFVAAIAGGNPTQLGQAWHACLHAHATWQPADAPLLERKWKNKIYMMADDTYSLMKRAEKDFSDLHGPVKK